MSNKLPKIEIQGNEIEKIRKLLKVYSIIVFNEELTERESQALSEYIIYGISAKTNKIIQLNYGIEPGNLRMLIKRMRDKGLLIDKVNKQGKELHPDLEYMKEKFYKEKNRLLILQVW